jgi:hypothetical protein
MCGNPACGAVLVRRPKEQLYRFRARRCCSVRCSNAVRQTPRRLDPETKPCAGCDTTCVRRPREPASCWARRRYCSSGCARRGRIVDDTVPKVCPSCGEQFGRRVGSESVSQFRVRKTCSRECGLSATGRARQVDPGATKVCPQCGTVFRRAVGVETTTEFRVRTHCSRPCANRGAGLSRRADPHVELPAVKVCGGCGVGYRRPPGVGPKAWLARKFCGAACSRGSVPSPRPAKPSVSSSGSGPAVAPVVERVVWRPASWGGPVKAAG